MIDIGQISKKFIHILLYDTFSILCRAYNLKSAHLTKPEHGRTLSAVVKNQLKNIIRSFDFIIKHSFSLYSAEQCVIITSVSALMLRLMLVMVIIISVSTQIVIIQITHQWKREKDVPLYSVSERGIYSVNNGYYFYYWPIKCHPNHTRQVYLISFNCFSTWCITFDTVE